MKLLIMQSSSTSCHLLSLFVLTGFYSPYRTLTFLNGLLDPQTFGRTPWLGDRSNATSSLLGPNIPFITLFSNTLNLFSSLRIRDQVTHPYKTRGKIMVSGKTSGTNVNFIKSNFAEIFLKS
jgi:hypothetical protein